MAETLFGNGNPDTTVVGTINRDLSKGISFQTINIVPPQFSLLAVKDQVTGATGDASILFNGFSLVPGPIAGAGLPGLLAVQRNDWLRAPSSPPPNRLTNKRTIDVSQSVLVASASTL